MAAMIVSKRASVAKLAEKLMSTRLRPMAGAWSYAARSFNTETQRRDLEQEKSIDVDRRGADAPVVRRRGMDFPSFFSDVLDPFSPTRTLSQVLNLMNQMLDIPFAPAARGMGGAALRREWDAREDDNALYLRIDMPGLDKEHVKVTTEEGTLVIKGEAKESDDDDDAPRRYSTRIDLLQHLYKMDQIKAEIKNGVLKIIVPKVKKEERKDVIEVPIE